MSYSCKPNITASLFALPAIAWLIIALVGCTTTPPHVSTTESSNCRQLFAAFTRTTNQYAVTDTQSHPIPGYPYLHIDRFLAGFDLKPEHTTEVDAWLDQAQALALETHSIEFANLPLSEQQRLQQTSVNSGLPFISALKTCSEQLRTIEFDNNAQRNIAIKTVFANVRMPDDYKTWQRLVGLYALTALPVVYGIKNWHQESRQHFQQTYNDVTGKGALTRYLPAQTQTLTRAQVGDIIKQSIDNALGIPEIPQDQIMSVFASYAPVFEIDTVTDSDRIGTPAWQDHETASIDISEVSVFYKLSYTFFDNRILPQLNYIIWFPSRPCNSFIDILCGHMDGLMWRVTLDHDGTPIHYDAVHNCGCYHTFFPTQHIQKQKLPETFEEQAFTPIEAPEINEGERILLRIESGSHHIVSIVNETQASQHTNNTTVESRQTRYRINHYNQLRTLQTKNNQRKSLFQTDGLVAGTQRSERFILWPMGVPSPGSMRQWGHHATAFVGRRYFDDPCLLQWYYSPAKTEPGLSTDSVNRSHFTCEALTDLNK